MSRIAVCTPTYNRRWSWEWSRLCFDKQEIPAERLLWIVLDNSDDPEKDWSPSKEHPCVTYIKVEGKRTVGDLRNICLDEALKTDAEYIVFWDDDDYYPPTRISAGLRALDENPKAEYSGCSTLYVLLTRENLLMKVGPYGDNHSTAATWTVRRAYAEKHRFDPTKTRAEETSFMSDWRTPMAMVQPEDSILVMGHAHNTVDKSQISTDPMKFMAGTVNSANGKMVARMKWFRTPDVWDKWRSTFSGASSA